MGSMPTNYTTTFYDNFKSPYLDSGKWPVTYGGGSSNGAYSYSHGNISTGNGLVINTTKTGGGWVTGGISQGWNGGTYGLYQVDAKVNPGKGIGPNILLWPNNNQWPPEIDLLEAPNGQGNAYMSLHWAGPNGQNEYTTINTGVNVNSYHNYAVDWEPNQLTFYVDGNQVWSTTSHIPTIPMGLGIAGYVANSGDTWFGGGPNSSTPSTVSFDVAWASISKPGSGGTPAPTPTPAPSGSGTGGSGSTAITSAAIGNPNSTSAQYLYSSKGTDILQGGIHAQTVYYAAMSNPDGWTEIDNWHAGDLAVLVGAQQGKATLSWAHGTDPNGHWGATASISLNGNGHVDEKVTFAGVSTATLLGSTWQNGWLHNGAPNIGIHG